MGHRVTVEAVAAAAERAAKRDSLVHEYQGMALQVGEVAAFINMLTDEEAEYASALRPEQFYSFMFRYLENRRLASAS